MDKLEELIKMKLKDLDMNCGKCVCIDFCAEPYEELCLCCDSRFEEMTQEEYIKMAQKVVINSDKRNDETLNEFIARIVYENLKKKVKDDVD